MDAAGRPDPDSATTHRSTDGLDERRRRILAFEARAWRDPARKADAIRDELDLSPARYYRLLAELVDDPAALRHDPMLVKRLQRQRAARAAARAERAIPTGAAIETGRPRPRQDP
ncbi:MULTISPECIES: DUF3263 domain-containing protein [Agromyces]|uniref:DUF3263 domain-containing protein n=1 Tax=Agromyces indicus TaxID=758919 RepID=A0ABU1FKX1_9MICO|nr:MULTISPECIES: DUF3263 domain-containing protein [Agromyces]KZE92966.1 hypothetical protein AVP42_02039 [Agromyces sp. NDB4Y10]MCK8609932.1 DUF3263 domain-containing protein [Agromyces sp. C10]MDR5692397.1 DUF3263 domain-containing protein [Agromyces indicus]